VRARKVKCPNPACPFKGQGRQLEALGQTIIGYCDGCVALTTAWDRERDLWDRIDRHLAAARVPDRLRPLGLASFPSDERGAAAVRTCRVWLAGWSAGSRSNLILWGNVGTGKSGLAWGLTQEVVKLRCARLDPDAEEWVGGICAFENWRELLADMRAAISVGARGRLPALARARAAGVLVLDDLGAERVTDFAREELAGLVEARHGARRPTVVTSNYLPSVLASRLGHEDEVVGRRILSRLTEDSMVVEVRGPDRRKQQGVDKAGDSPSDPLGTTS
jgi:DNA replication protein DnaC